MAGLQPSPEADPTVLIRRLTYDLHGLPPTPEESDFRSLVGGLASMATPADVADVRVRPSG